MTVSRFHSSTMLRRSAYVCLFGVALVSAVSSGHAQTNQGVTVNLGVLDDIDPMATIPRLLMPSTSPQRGRIVLTPPAGVDPITPQRSRIVLRPPPGAPARVTTAPSIAVPPPAAAASAPPISVTSTPPSAPVPAPVPAPPASPEPAPAPAPAMDVVDDPMPMPAPAMPVPAEVAAPQRADESPEQTASLPPAEEDVVDDAPLSITFGMEETDLPAGASTGLSDLAAQMKSDDSLRVQLMAYASSADSSPSSVRRKSLSRALSVREFLMDQGVQSTRIEVRALGDQSEGGAPDRVDAVIEKR